MKTLMKVNGLVAGCLFACAATAAGGCATKPLTFVAAEQASQTISIYEDVPGKAPLLRWSWSAEKDPNAKKDKYRYGNPSECKVRDDGKTIIMTASGGCAAGIDVKTGVCKWYVRADGNPHSVEVLPDGRVAVASSTGATLKIFDVKEFPFEPKKQPAKTVLKLPSGHGVHWDAKRKSLFALGMDILFELDYNAADMSVTVRRQWNFKEMGGERYGHDLTPDGKGGYFFTTEKTVWHINPDTGKLKKAHTLDHAKGYSPTAKDALVTLPKVKWWTDTLMVFPVGSSDTNTAYKITLPGAKFYKARHVPKSLLPNLPKKK